MADQAAPVAQVAAAQAAQAAPAAETEELASDELLVEEISIDGMCGVY
jgi:mycofactocin precursor